MSEMSEMITEIIDGLVITRWPDAEHVDAVPHSCTRRQGQRALHELGLLQQVEDTIAGIPDPDQKKLAQIEYDAYVWELSNPTLIQMWAQVGQPPEKLAEAFKLAVTF